jgi:hypothetical protein
MSARTCWTARSTFKLERFTLLTDRAAAIFTATPTRSSATPPPESVADYSPLRSRSFGFVLLGAQRFGQLRATNDVRAFLDGAGPAAIGAILGSAIPSPQP